MMFQECIRKYRIKVFSCSYVGMHTVCEVIHFQCHIYIPVSCLYCRIWIERSCKIITFYKFLIFQSRKKMQYMYRKSRCVQVYEQSRSLVFRLKVVGLIFLLAVRLNEIFTIFKDQQAKYGERFIAINRPNASCNLMARLNVGAIPQRGSQILQKVKKSSKDLFQQEEYKVVRSNVQWMISRQSLDKNETIICQSLNNLRTIFGQSLDNLRTIFRQSSDNHEKIISTIIGQPSDNHRTVIGQP